MLSDEKLENDSGGGRKKRKSTELPLNEYNNSEDIRKTEKKNKKEV